MLGDDLHSVNRQLTTIAKEFGPWISTARKAAGLSVADAARQIGVSRVALYAWENGESLPEESRFNRIDDVYRLGKGVLVSILGKPLAGPSLDYWVGRWEQQTAHLQRVLADHQALVEYMRQKAGEGIQSPEPNASLEYRVKASAMRLVAESAPTSPSTPPAPRPSTDPEVLRKEPLQGKAPSAKPSSRPPRTR